MTRSTVACLYPVVFLYSTIVFATYTPRTILVLNLLRKRICGQDEAFDDDDGANCDEDRVSSEAAIFSTWIGLASALPAILMSGPMGTIANRYGRLYPPRIVLTGAILQYSLIAAVAQFEFDVEWLIVGSLFEGLTGSYTAFLMGTSSYIADCNALDAATLSDTGRVERFSFVEAGLSLGILVGPVCGGIFVAFYSFGIFFAGAAAMLALLFVYVSTCIPESLPLALGDDRPGTNDSSSTWAVLKLAFQTRPFHETEPANLSIENISRSDAEFDYKTLSEENIPATRLAFVSLAFMMSFGSNNAMSQIFVLYTARAWKWSSAGIGAYISALGGAGTVGLLFLRRIFKWVSGRDCSDLSLMLAGAAAAACFNVLFGALNSPVAAYALLPLLALTLAAFPSYRNTYSVAFEAKDQARIFSAVSVLEAVPSVIAPLVYNQIYAATVATMPMAVFLAVAAASIGAFGLLYTAKTTLAPEKPHVPPADPVLSPIAVRDESFWADKNGAETQKFSEGAR